VDLVGDLGFTFFASLAFGAPLASSKTAARTHKIAGIPSNILCHIFPSSRDPNSCPLRVPK
jgi:hypothetical protein